MTILLDYKQIAKKLKIARLEMNFSQQQVANYIGKKSSDISHYETGDKKN